MKLISLLEGLALGAGLMYVFDPEHGKRRQAMTRDKVQKQMRCKQEALGVMQRDFMNRSRGMVTQIKAARTQGDIASDEIVEARVRSAMGRFCSHPKAVHCEVHNGEVTLSGQILTSEVQQVVQCIKNTKGVTHVTNNLEVLQDSAGVSSLQGDGRISTGSSQWTPATGLVMTALGSTMTLYGLAKRGIIGSLVGAVGFGIVTKAFRDTENRFASGTHTSGSAGTNNMDMPGTPVMEPSIGSYEGLNTGEVDGITEQTVSMPVSNDENSGMI